MMENTEDANSKFFPANEQEKDLYTIPSYSRWFSWDDIHETERNSVKEFFDGSSVSRTPKIYKDYRDFIINKYREEPSRKLTFTEIRKSLIGDISLIHKVFLFLEKWGLINLGVSSSSLPSDGLVEAAEGERRLKVRFEEGAPNGVRVVSVPNSSKVVPLVSNVSDVGEAVENGFRLPPLASYSDVFGDLVRQRGSVCVNCGEECISGCFESKKQESSVMCLKCFKNGSSGESKGEEDFKLKDCKDDIYDNQRSDFWSDSETLLLLESVLKHGDDWDLVAQNVQTKNKFDCISRLIQLPFGEPILAEIMVDTTNEKGDERNSISSTNDVEQLQSTAVESQKPIKKEAECHEQTDDVKQVGDGGSENTYSKRRCLASLEEAGGPLMKQVATLSTAASPIIAAAAAEAAFTALCDEIHCGKEVFEAEVDNATAIFEFSSSNDEPERGLHAEKLETGERDTLSETQEASPAMNSVPLAFQIRTAVATAFGAAAAHAKVLADQEDREIEHLVASIIEKQMRKLHLKIKHFEELELIMENECNQIQEIKESIITDRINFLRQALKAGISRWRDHTAVKSFMSSVF